MCPPSASIPPPCVGRLADIANVNMTTIRAAAQARASRARFLMIPPSAKAKLGFPVTLQYTGDRELA
jgi:hypothetical protein